MSASRITLARPFLAERTVMELSVFWLLRASCCFFVMLGVGGCSCLRMLLTALPTLSAHSVSSGLTADSTLAVISVAGTLPGAKEKFRPFFSKNTSGSLRVLMDDKLITPFVLSKKISVKQKAAFVAIVFQTCAVDGLWWY